MPQSRTEARRTIGSYWEASVPQVKLDRQLIGNALFDVAIIGAGFAGLSAALRLAQAGVSVCVLEAEHVGYGASGRNGGFCCLGGTKLDERRLIKKFGLEEARRFVAYQVAGVNLVAQRLDSWGVDADRHSNGEIYLAHRRKDFAGFQAEAAFLKENFGIKARVLSKTDLDAEGYGGPTFHGGLQVPYGFALNPMAYVQALADQVRRAGGKIFGKSPVTGMTRDNDRWQLETEHGFIRARKVVLAGNGYAREDAPKWLHGRTLPVMSSILVTRPLSEGELATQGWTSDTMAADTRNLLHYFRLLPDRRFLFGTRGGIFENAQSLTAMYKRARSDFDEMFPAWAGIEAEHSWYGHVCLARNLTPFVGEVPGLGGVYAAMGWHGSGIAMASISGEKVAGLILGKLQPEDLPVALRRPFARFPLPSLRKLYLQGAYWWYGWQDR
ncbi:FAD-dependent oxidoreductase [Roseibium algicola]|uniref:FAD-dependent oxidoreductase n=1 Tax=Roseibium algicola TaxID=2857014 RepID=A0ABN4WSP4_9HYPH|nr:FAD-binding oxidoreductase [Roseibium aggregatum]AQQ03116.1 FAD-dependent oxidoreductase [Roseibium aggregatum]